jgi:putative methyltransferase (TIGR04325 family)
MVLEKTRKLAARDPRLMIGEHQAISTLLAVTTAIAVTRRAGKPLRVLDFGGAFGTSYHLVRDALPGDYKWAVVETPTFAALGESLKMPGLRMFDSLEKASEWLGETDLLYVSSAIQYVRDPIEMVRLLLASRPACAAWLRSSFSEGKQVVVLQSSRLKDNGPGPLPEGFTDVELYYPKTYVSRPDFLACFDDYRLVIKSSDGTPGLRIGAESVVEGQNYLFVREAL